MHLECSLAAGCRAPDREGSDPNTVVFGEVIGIDIADEVIVDGRVDVLRLDPIARLGYDQYTRVVEVFAMQRPGWPGAYVLASAAGRARIVVPCGNPTTTFLAAGGGERSQTSETYMGQRCGPPDACRPEVVEHVTSRRLRRRVW